MEKLLPKIILKESENCINLWVKGGGCSIIARVRVAENEFQKFLGSKTIPLSDLDDETEEESEEDGKREECEEDEQATHRSSGDRSSGNQNESTQATKIRQEGEASFSHVAESNWEIFGERINHEDNSNLVTILHGEEAGQCSMLLGGGLQRLWLLLLLLLLVVVVVVVVVVFAERTGERGEGF